jgi:hypothetical protein
LLLQKGRDLDSRDHVTTVQRPHIQTRLPRVRQLVRFLRLPRRDKRALTSAAALVALTRAALWVLPFRTVLATADRLAGNSRARPLDDLERNRMIRAVETAARALLPEGPCLSQAIVVDLLLRRRGYPSQLKVGVAHGPKGELRAHAWVEADGEVVIGGAESRTDFRPFPHLRQAP